MLPELLTDGLSPGDPLVLLTVGGLLVVGAVVYARPRLQVRLSARLPVASGRLVVALGIALAVAVLVALAARAGAFAVPDSTAAAVRELLVEYGYLALFVVFVIEGAMLLYFAPSESVVPAAILLLADSPLEYVLVVAVAVAGATVGQTALFLLAKYAGREFLVERRYLRVRERRLDRFDTWFDRWGPLSIPASNTLPFVRGMVTVPAGFAEMDLRRFVALSALGTLVFETVLAAATLGLLRLV